VVFAFLSGSPALDLAGTLKWRRDRPEELLVEPADLQQWVAESDAFGVAVRVDPDGLSRAIALREAIYRLATDRLDGHPFDRHSLALVNELAAGPPLAVQLHQGGLRRSGDLHAVLAEIARDAVTVLADPASGLKECARPACTRVYLDQSRGARRAWCGMSECGNRAKAATYRARKRSVDLSGSAP
jgi:predicted RNA-binding Zn ribbon-like protein